MHEEILSASQLSLAGTILPDFPKFYLCGGTALALQIGHRKSIDFDLAIPEEIRPESILRSLQTKGHFPEHTLTATSDELTIILQGVKFTFFSFPFPIRPTVSWSRAGIRLPEIPVIGSMKAYALGRRSKWKDYVDLYFMLRDHVTLSELIHCTRTIFRGAFNAKLFLEQLCYFEDLDMTEQVDFTGDKVQDETIREWLTLQALTV
ncbi:Nucleotidyl transferase AbiEii toxin, Type IV TA system [Desulfomicrobium norvegicum]|uniref:Nucleotidyl transferase AbiEii toxin, Type IV TA system n=2 Tax=Desulfomicrobium norvegicum (strain DSM 1741 / NCIMB 8310) TaxID=52561 RepID=A0A8G2C5A8_DESNO|nr:Nucleotidyl transferase AbiEii toxin, Type IV TA system [Desulfomicrobium norvegicum]